MDGIDRVTNADISMNLKQGIAKEDGIPLFWGDFFYKILSNLQEEMLIFIMGVHCVYW